MTLSTHIVIAAAVAKPLIGFNPLFGFVAGLASHYLSDAIPHWDYKLKSLPEKDKKSERSFSYGKEFFEDLRKIAFDAAFGAIVVFIIVRPQTFDELLFWGLVMAGGVFPDFLQGIYYTRRAPFLTPLQKFHDRMHTKIRLGPYPLIGVPFQMAIFAMAAYFLL